MHLPQPIPFNCSPIFQYYEMAATFPRKKERINRGGRKEVRDEGEPAAEPSPEEPPSGEWTLERLLEEHPIFSNPRLNEPDQIDWSQMEPNEFYPGHVQTGDKIAGLTVVSVMREHIDMKSYTFEFDGELVLEGSFRVLRDEERGTQSSDVYFTLDESSRKHFPLDKRFSAEKHPIVLGIPNGRDFVRAGDPIEDRPVKARFRKLLLQFSPSKSAESRMEVVEILSS